jgi:short-subunit dehydrogenase involved in D-alanine esterification of teichoic acids
MKVALVVGGSGMLAGLTKKLSKEFDIVGVIGRNNKRLDELALFASNIVPISTDYSNQKFFFFLLVFFFLLFSFCLLGFAVQRIP